MLVNEEKEVCNIELNEYSEKCSTIKEILKSYFNNNDLYIIKMKCLSGSKSGDNYMSVVKRIIVEFSLGNGSTHTTSLIVKRHIVDRARRELFRCDAAFKNEISAYCHIVPVLKRFSNNNLPLPNNFFAGCDNEGELIVLEDLAQKGLKMVNRLDGFDFQHSSVVMRELASFHATSIAMKIMEPKNFFNTIQNVHEVVFIDTAADFYSQQLDYSLSQAISSLMNDSVADAASASILKTFKGRKLFDIMMNHVTNSDDIWNVLCHGDLWSNNIMFHYKKNGKVNYAKFVDLQTLRYSNLTCDILMVMFSSTKYKMRMQHMDSLIDIYRTALINTLRENMKEKYSCELAELEKMYTTESIKHEIARTSLYGLGMSLWVLPAITFVTDVKNLDSLLDSLNDSDKHDEIMASLRSNEYNIRVRDIVKEFLQRGYLENIFIDT